jgi:hypothetical protein
MPVRVHTFIEKRLLHIAGRSPMGTKHRNAAWAAGLEDPLRGWVCAAGGRFEHAWGDT